MTAIPEPREGESARGLLVRVLKLGIAGLVAVFATGGAVGAGVAAAERGLTLGRVAVVAGFALVALAAAAWVVVLLRRGRPVGPEARGVTTARRMVVVSGAIGGVIGVLLALAAIGRGGEPAFAPFSSAPLPPWLAAAAIAVLVLVIPVTWIWHRNIDEHESAAYRLAALIALYVYFWLSMVWWLAARGGFLPAVDGMAIFAATIAVWGLAWAWARFR